AVLEVFADTDTHTRVVSLAVSDMPTSGKPDDLLAAAGIDADHIAAAVRSLVSSGGGPRPDYEPQQVPVNVYETHGALVLVAPLPGVMADDVEVTIEDGQVLIEAEMRTPAEKGYLLHEWHYGPFRRTVDIPAGFGGNAAASFGNGQLAVRLERSDTPVSGKVVVHPD
ncbi:MAG TPA: Hsp20/alpha crystallin family protein, partial [Acidimicrobiales bacterium]|nr:Hsp20/alpha crystallin family protein [Acidimicrobiales bacterium]